MQPDETEPSRRPPLWLFPVRAAVVLFVLWHLAFMVITNASLSAPTIDADGGPQTLKRGVRAWFDAVERYESYAVMDQAWGMFTSPLWRSIPFPAGRVSLSDGTEVEVLSVNEPADMTNFFRLGGARLRKVEHYLVTHDLTGTYQEPMQRRYAQTFVERWREMNPGDGRKPVGVTILRRDFTAPPPGESWRKKPVPAVSKVVRFELAE